MSRHQGNCVNVPSAVDYASPKRQSAGWRQNVQPILPAALQGVQQHAGGVVAELAREQRALDIQQVAGPAVGGAAALAVQVRRPHEALPRHPAGDSMRRVTSKVINKRDHSENDT